MLWASGVADLVVARFVTGSAFPVHERTRRREFLAGLQPGFQPRQNHRPTAVQQRLAPSRISSCTTSSREESEPTGSISHVTLLVPRL